MADISAVRSAYVQAAYAKAAEAQAPSPVLIPEPQRGFGDMVAEAAQNAVETVRTGDQVAIQGLTGQASLQQVVEATMAMESTVQVSIAIRDKLVEAYQDIMRMPI